MNELEKAARQALEALIDLTNEMTDRDFVNQGIEAITALRRAIEQQPAAPEFISHEVTDTYDWTEWVNPNNDSYMMKCCDCGLVHEMQFKVVRYSEGDECEFVDDPDLQPVFRARRAEETWQEKDTAHRAGGLPQPAAWVGLTMEDKKEYVALDYGGNRFDAMDWAEKRLKEKNT